MKTPHYSMSYIVNNNKIRFTLEFQTNGYVGIGFGSKKMDKVSDDYHTSCYILSKESNHTGKISNGYCEGRVFFPLPSDTSANLLIYEELPAKDSDYFPVVRRFVFERVLSPIGHYPIVINTDVPMIWSTGRTDNITEPHIFERGLVFNFEKGFKTSFGSKIAGWIGLIVIGLLVAIY